MVSAPPGAAAGRAAKYPDRAATLVTHSRERVRGSAAGGVGGGQPVRSHAQRAGVGALHSQSLRVRGAGGYAPRGGGGIGVMGTIADAVLAAGGHSKPYIFKARQNFAFCFSVRWKALIMPVILSMGSGRFSQDRVD